MYLNVEKENVNKGNQQNMNKPLLSNQNRLIPL